MYPVLFEFGIVTVFSLWFCVALGFVVGSILFVRLAKRNRVKLSVMADHSLLLFTVTLVVSRIFFIVLNPDLYFYNFHFTSIFNFFALWDKGLSFWGAVIAFCVTIWIISKNQREPMSRYWDIFTISLLVGMAFGNLGAFLDGINYGKPTELPWGVVFRSANVNYILAVHPTEIYAIIYTVLIVIALLWMLKRTRMQLPGFVAHTGLLLFSVCKFLEEFFRGDEVFKLFGMRVPQLIAMIIALVSGYLWYARSNREGFWAVLRSRENLTE